MYIYLSPIITLIIGDGIQIVCFYFIYIVLINIAGTVRKLKQHFRIGTWNVRTMKHEKLEGLLKKQVDIISAFLESLSIDGLKKVTLSLV